jgi:hypothetical protein
MGDNDDIKVNDNSIIFTKTKNGRVLVLNEGEVPRIGDTIGIHPQNIQDEGISQVTHGLNAFQPGDQVIIRKLKTGEEAAFKPGFKGMYGCQNVNMGLSTSHGTSNPDGTRQYYAYTYHFDEPFYREDHDLNLTFGFRHEFHYDGFQCWYPYGGVWIGFSSDGSGWFWCAAGGDPYAMIRGLPIFVCGPKGFYWPLGDSTSMGPDWCYPDALNVNVCSTNNGETNACGASINAGVPINFIHILISTNSSLYWDNHTGTDLSRFTACRGVPTEVDPCPQIYGNQKCEY